MPSQEFDHLIAASRRGPSIHKHERDGLIMDTNKSSIVSKRSVEKLYFTNDGKGQRQQHEYFRYFVSKFKRRSPLINRGYWLRMKAIESSVEDFLTDPTKEGKRKVIVNLGCGYDPLPFIFLGNRPDLCENTTFVDIDYPDLMKNKLLVVSTTPEILDVIGDFRPSPLPLSSDSAIPCPTLLASSPVYALIAQDLSLPLSPLQSLLSSLLPHSDIPDEVSILFISEVSTAYMKEEASQRLFSWTISAYPSARFVLLEQHLPDGREHPFAATMLGHFEKLRTPLQAVGTMGRMRERFVEAGYPEEGIGVRSLWEVWGDENVIKEGERRGLDGVEGFDEWEEFAVYAGHYFLLVAEGREGGRAEGSSSTSTSNSNSNSNSPDAGRRSKSSTDGSRSDGISSPVGALQVHELRGSHDFRRFAAILPPSRSDDFKKVLGLHGGMGTRERESSCNTYARTNDILKLSSPPLRSGIMSHTITTLGTTSDCLLVGGRTSPEKAIAQCWVRQDNEWQQTCSLPSGRYRHAAIPIVLPATSVSDPRHTVMIFGGKTSDGQVLNEWLIWTEAGWQRIEVTEENSPCARFGASMITDGIEGLSGVLLGGMNDLGLVINDFWHWELTPDLKLSFRDMTAKVTGLLKDDAGILGRFGAQLVRSNRGILLIGGVSGGGILTRRDEILNLKTLQPEPIEGFRPLFIGCSVHNVDDGLLILGGGATCFSFGTTWNRSCIMNDSKSGESEVEWRLITESIEEKSAGQSEVDAKPTNGVCAKSMPSTREIPKLQISHELNFQQYIEARRPVVLTGCDLGPCIAAWNTQYLKDRIGADRTVSIHVATSQRMDFQNKNFTYETQEFGKFLDAINSGEKLYLRSLSRAAPSEKPTSLEADFPEIAHDFTLPSELSVVKDNAHSSPLRISGPVQMWLHYDVMANVLCQIIGSKRVILFPPSDVTYLGFEAGASSSSLDVFDQSIESNSDLACTSPVATTLHPGDVLLIPPMWIHSTAPTGGSSIAVNVFFRDLEKGYAAGRDVYGNRDLAAYEKGRKDLAKIVHSFDDLPDDVSGFYLERLGKELLDKGRAMSRRNG